MFDPGLFLAAAKDVYNGKVISNDEACLRTAVSRAYYAAFLSVREVVRREYRNARFEVQHAELARSLASSADPIIASIGTRLNGLRIARNACDYRLGHTVIRRTVGLEIHNATVILDEVPGTYGRIPLGIPESRP
jgi:hypothetical protein